MRCRLLAGAMGAVALLGVAGCGTGVATQIGGGTVAPSSYLIRGHVHGGQQPVQNSLIQLWVVNPTTMKGGSQELTTQAVYSDVDGDFNLSGDYSACPTNSLAYITATGGDAGAGTNNAIELVAAIGPCNVTNLNANTTLLIDERSTIATAYALGQFALDYRDIGATTAESTGISNAFAVAGALANIATGTVPGATLPASASISVPTLNTLADILAACVNGTSGTCATLLGSTVRDGVMPKDTFSAALGMASSPGSNVTTLARLATRDSPFQPIISLSNDLTLSITINSGVASPDAIAIDAGGEAWVTNTAGNFVTKISPIGALLSGANGYTSGGINGAQGIAIDDNGYAWIANTGNNSVIRMTPGGISLGAITGFNVPVSVAVDSGDNIWVASYGANGIRQLNNSGGAGPAAGTLAAANALIGGATSVAIDSSGRVWVASGGNGTLVALDATSGSVLTGAGLTDGWLQGTGQVALDPSGTAWVAAPGINALTAITSSGLALSPGSPDYNGGLQLPVGVAIDGVGNIWVTSAQTLGSISQLAAGTGASVAGATDVGALNTPVGIAVDASGDVWTTNSGSNSVSIFVGLASPAAVPLVTRLQ